MIAGSAVTTFTHDAYGRMTGRSGATTETYGWDARSELATVASSEGTVTYQYDAAGLPARRKSSVSGDATDTAYFWSGGKLAASKSADGTLMRFIYGPGGMPLQLIVTKPGGSPTPYWYHLDPLGNVIALTDAEGWTTASYDYDPWGKPISTGAYQYDLAISRANPLRYRGYFYDAELELYVLPARVYDPALKRFLSVDPVAEKMGVPQSANRYAYCQSNPITFIDPDGTDILLGNYYPPAQSQYEPDIPQQDWTGDGYGTKHSSGPRGTSSGHGEWSSGQRERQAADARAALDREKLARRDLAESRARDSFDTLLLRSRPDHVNVLFTMVGANLDSATAVAIVVDLASATYDYRKMKSNDATPMDVIWDLAGIFPYVTTSTLVLDSLAVPLSSLGVISPYAEPRKVPYGYPNYGLWE